MICMKNTFSHSIKIFLCFSLFALSLNSYAKNDEFPGRVKYPSIPYITIYKGEQHHLQRYDNVAETSVLLITDDHTTKEDIDLIVMGTQGLSGLARLMLGSVADRVLRGASCPVLLIPSRVKTEE